VSLALALALRAVTGPAKPESVMHRCINQIVLNKTVASTTYAYTYLSAAHNVPTGKLKVTSDDLKEQVERFGVSRLSSNVCSSYKSGMGTITALSQARMVVRRSL
jgi:hypothetical protein